MGTAPELIVRVLGDTAPLQHSLRQASRESARFSGQFRTLDRDVVHSVRGVISASGAFSHLTRSLAIASGSFVAGAGITAALKDSIDAARNAAKAQASLAAQMRVSGESFRQNKDRVEQTALSYAKFGFDNTQVVASLVVLERATGDISRAIGLQGVTAELARAKNLDLAVAALDVGKALSGQETALRRLVPGLSKSAHGLELVRDAQRKLAGQAAANTTAADRFAASLHNSEEIVGSALLPILDRYLKSLSRWLDRMNRTGALQRDVNKAVKDAQTAFDDARTALAPLVTTFKDVGDAVGGTKNELKLLVSAFAAFKVARLLDSFGLLAGSIRTVGTDAATAQGQVAGLRGGLAGLRKLGAITLAIDLIINKNEIDAWLKSHGLGALSQSGLGLLTNGGAPPILGSANTQFGISIDKDIGPGTGAPVAGRFPAVHFNIPGGPDLTGRPAAGLPATTAARGFGLPSFPTKFTAPPSAPLNARQQFQLALAANPDSLALLRQQAARDRAAVAFAERLRARGTISNSKYLTEVTGYQSDLHQTLDHITSILDAAASKAAAARAKQQAASAKAAKEITAFQDAALKFTSSLGVGRTAETLKHLRFTGTPTFQLPAGLRLAQAQAEAFGHTIAKTLGREFTLPGNTPGLVSAGNVDLLHRKVAHLPGGEIATVHSFSVSTDRGETLLPQVIDGKLVSMKAAIAHFIKTGENLGVFDSIKAANAYAIKLHEQQAKFYGPGGAGTHQVLTLRDVLIRERAAAKKALASGTLSINAQIDALNEIASINGQLVKKSGGDVTKFRHIARRNLFAGLGLDPAQLRNATGRVAALGPNGVIPAPTPAFGMNVNIGTFVSSARTAKQLESDLRKLNRNKATTRRGG